MFTYFKYDYFQYDLMIYVIYDSNSTQTKLWADAIVNIANQRLPGQLVI